MKIKCKIHGDQDIIFFAWKGIIRRKCSYCNAENNLKLFKNKPVEKDNQSKKLNSFFNSFNKIKNK